MTVSISQYDLRRAMARTLANIRRPTSSNLSSRPQRSRKSSPSGPPFSLRYAHTITLGYRACFLTCKQALEGKDVKDLLLNVGSGGGAAPAAAGAGGAAAGGAAEAAPAEEAKEEGTSYPKLAVMESSY